MGSLGRRLATLEVVWQRQRQPGRPLTVFDPMRLTETERGDVDRLAARVSLPNTSGHRRYDFAGLDDDEFDRLGALICKAHDRERDWDR